MNGKMAFSSEAVHSFVDELLGEDLYAKRVPSLAKATVGTLRASSLTVSAIGHGLALAQGGLSRHAIKQVDRMLSNDGIDVDALLADWAGYCLGSRTEIVVAMDWTDKLRTWTVDHEPTNLQMIADRSDGKIDRRWPDDRRVTAECIEE